jgi:hypothetical protein
MKQNGSDPQTNKKALIRVNLPKKLVYQILSGLDIVRQLAIFSEKKLKLKPLKEVIVD